MRWLLLACLLGCGDSSRPAADASPIEPDAVTVAPDPVALLAKLPGACSVDKWCWKRPTPRGARITAVHATAPDDLWLAGDTAFVLSWNGTAWREHVLPKAPFPAARNISQIAGTGPNDVWLVVGNILYHYDGTTWAIRDTIEPGVDQTFADLWVAPNGDVWVTMDYATLRRSVGGGPFETMTIPQALDVLSGLGAIWGTAADDVWISARPGRMFHWDGTAFTEFSTGTYKSGGNLWGANANDAWVGGYDGTLVHWNGTSWTPVETGLGNGWYIKGISGLAANDVWWIAQKSSRFAALLHWDGTQLAVDMMPSDTVINDLEIVDGRWWLPADHGSILVKESKIAPMIPAMPPVNEPFRAAWGSSDRDMYFVGPGMIEHWDGDTWTNASVSGIQTINTISGVRNGNKNEVFVAGATFATDHYTGDVFHEANGAWTKTTVDPTHPLNGAWAIEPGEAIAVGDGGVVHRLAGGTWQPIASPTTRDLYAVWGPDRDHAIIVGDGGTILRWDRASPNTLTVEPSGVSESFRAVHGAGGVTWIASASLGNDNQVAVFSSTATGWARHPIPRFLGGMSIFAKRANEVVVTGNNGMLFRWNGSTFVEEDTLFGDTLSSVFQPPDGAEWLVGPHAMLQRAP